MNQTLEKLQEIEKNGYQIDFENVFNHAFENYKKIALYAGLVWLIFIILFVLFTVVSVVSIIGATELTNQLSVEKLKLENISESNLLYIGGGSLLISCLFSPFQAAFLKMADYGDKDQEFAVSSLFTYYKLPYLKEILVATFLISSISLAQATLLSYIKLDYLGSIINYFIAFITILTIPLIIFGDLYAIDAIKYSVKIVFKQPGVLLGLMIVAIIGSFVGFIGCCIGVLFTMPFLYSMNYAIYSAIIGVNNSIENE